MTAPRFIAGDWGTTHARLFLCGDGGRVLETRSGPGAARAGTEETFHALAAGWDARLPAILCGMAGSSIGWRAAPYLPCPIRPDVVAADALRFESRGRAIVLAPGLSCRNPLGAPDVMRGEETQILGALRRMPALRSGRHILCLPGTHTKWALLADGAVEHFVTAFSGELFALLCRHSILGDGSDAVHGAAFADALLETASRPQAELLHRLFETRSRQLDGTLKKEDAASYISGLVIGADVSGAKRILGGMAEATVIGEAKLAGLYVEALAAHGIAASHVAGEEAVLAGLVSLHDALFARSTGHA